MAIVVTVTGGADVQTGLGCMIQALGIYQYAYLLRSN